MTTENRPAAAVFAVKNAPDIPDTAASASGAALAVLESAILICSAAAFEADTVPPYADCNIAVNSASFKPFPTLTVAKAEAASLTPPNDNKALFTSFNVPLLCNNPFTALVKADVFPILLNDMI